ncbi:hypothetical protein FHT98_0033 [Bosea sp. AK1]|uniref:hypothetical protein n=1 Tax=Bosea sp. AK1 TaxID=2587160 RepID=UPI0011711010|nr:hypothetical protein [Bosea sp. AK1]TQI72333.1 hypothetical protein FHT98_0033 [Bosea sp. AK1]
MIDHVSVGTNDIARARAFYDSVLGCIGPRLLQSDEHSADYGVASILSASRRRSTVGRQRAETACMSHSRSGSAISSRRSTAQSLPMAAATPARLACVLNTTPIISEHSC